MPEPKNDWYGDDPIQYLKYSQKENAMYSQDEVHALIAEKNAALAENERIKQQLTKELSDALAETAGMRIIYNMAHEAYTLCRKLLMESGAENADANSIVINLQNELAALKEEIEFQRNGHLAAQRSMLTQGAEMAALRTENAALKDRVKATDNESNEIRRKNVELRKQVPQEGYVVVPKIDLLYYVPGGPANATEAEWSLIGLTRDLLVHEVLDEVEALRRGVGVSYSDNRDPARALRNDTEAREDLLRHVIHCKAMIAAVEGDEE